jgi:hypothetical protein
MRWTPMFVALLLLLALCVVTASVNVLSTHYGYRMGETMRHSTDLQQMIAYRRSQIRHMLGTAELAAWAFERGVVPEDLLRDEVDGGSLEALALGE